MIAVHGVTIRGIGCCQRLIRSTNGNRDVVPTIGQISKQARGMNPIQRIGISCVARIVDGQRLVCSSDRYRQAVSAVRQVRKQSAGVYSVHHVRIMHRCHVRALCDACVGLVVNGGRCVLNGCVCLGMVCGVACLRAINQGESLAQATTLVLQRSDYNRSIRATHLKEHIIVCLACGLVHCNLQAVQSVAVARNPLNATTCVCTCGEVIRSRIYPSYSITAAIEAFRDIE